MPHAVASEMNELELTGSLPYKCFRSILGHQELQWKLLRMTLWKMTRGICHDLGWCPDLESDDTYLHGEKGILHFPDYREIVSLKVYQSLPSFSTWGISLKPMALCLTEHQLVEVAMFLSGDSSDCWFKYWSTAQKAHFSFLDFCSCPTHPLAGFHPLPTRFQAYSLEIAVTFCFIAFLFHCPSEHVMWNV